MKHFKKITSLFLALLMVISAGAALTVSTSAGGADTDIQADFTISSADEFVEILATKANANGWYAGKTVVLTDDIDMSGIEWNCDTIGAISFRGTLDGQGHTVRNLKLTLRGLFQNTNGAATFKNLSIVDFEVVGSNKEYIGVFTGQVQGGSTITFENVYVKANFHDNGTSAYPYAIGGFVGYLVNGGASKATFTNCVSEVTISGNAFGYGVGGFLGRTDGAGKVEMTDCAFIGDLSGATIDKYNNAYIGGVAGLVGGVRCAADFTRCVSLGKVNTGATYNASIAVLSLPTGTQTYNITDCYVANNTDKAFDATTTANVTNKFNLTFNSSKVYSTTAASALSELNTAFKSNGGFITEIKADALSETMPAIADSNKWTVVEGTVAYADDKTISKFIPRTVAKKFFTSPVGITGIQTRKSDEGYDVRFVGTVNFEDLEKYETVGFMYEVKHNGTLLTSGTEETSDVFSSIIAADETVTAEALNANAIFVAKLTGFASEEKFDITVTVFAKTADGTVIYDYSGASTFTACNPEA